MTPGGLILAEVSSRTTFELGRLQQLSERWHLLVLALLCAAIAGVVIWIYRRDSIELRPVLAVTMTLLRIVAFAGLLLYFLDVQKRTERKVTHHSRVVVMMDTSLSMGLRDSDSTSSGSSPTRLAQLTQVLHEQGLVSTLRKKHDVVLARFDSQIARLATLAKLNAAPQAEQARGAGKDDQHEFAWQSIAPQGLETRIGYALRDVLEQERTSPLSAIVLASDGQQNAGIDAQGAIDIAREIKVPIFTIGLGSERRPANVRVADLAAPTRAYPGDSFSITGYVQAQELAGRRVRAELTSRAVGAPASDKGRFEGAETVLLGAKSEVVPLKFEVTPAETGRRTYRFQVQAPVGDNNPADNFQEADVEIVDHKTRVLLVASGPTREYVFLRNQLRRDQQVVVDVWLQSATAGAVSQDANQILSDFPSTPQELFEYDCIVAFDPNWNELDQTQIDLLERWVAEKAGGLIAIAGPVQMDSWVQQPKMAKLRALYPVEFHRRVAMLEDGRFGSEIPWPIEFTREGLEAEFLWLADTASRSQQIWSDFAGVFGHYSVRGAKPAATVYGRYSDRDSADGNELPVYLAGQFYGSGRVFYLGSGEIWRLRGLADSYFEQFYTKLVRHVSQGRLLQGSSHGMLLVERDRYQLGSTVVVRAQLSGPQHEALVVPSVPLQVVSPDGVIATTELRADPTRKGMYLGQFTVLQEGTYRVELAIPKTSGELLSKRIQVKIPDLERENPERNDALLSTIASRTGGRYYIGADAALGRNNNPPLAGLLKDRTAVTYLAGVTDLDFERRWMRGLLFLICGALCLEWLIRRLSKLA